MSFLNVILTMTIRLWQLFFVRFRNLHFAPISKEEAEKLFLLCFLRTKSVCNIPTNYFTSLLP